MSPRSSNCPAGPPVTRIGPVVIDPAVALAPMAGFTDHCYRILAREYGCGLVFTEMIHAQGLLRGGRSVFF